MAEKSTRPHSSGRRIIEHFKFLSRLKWKGIGELLGETFSEWNDDNAQRLSASLAFFTLFSAAPLLVVVVGVGAAFFGHKAAAGQLAWQIRDLVGPIGAQSIQQVIRAAYQPRAGAIATSLGVFTLLLGASSVAVELHEALNIIWDVPAPGGPMSVRILALVKERFLSLLLVLGAGIVLMLSLIWSASISIMGRYFGALLPLPEFALHLASFGVSFIAISLVFAAIYKFVPDVRLTWSDVIVGACFSAFVFGIGRQLLAIYVSKVGFGSAYGAAGALVTVLMWVYYSALLFFFGAEFTKIYARRFGSHLRLGSHL